MASHSPTFGCHTAKLKELQPPKQQQMVLMVLRSPTFVQNQRRLVAFQSAVCLEQWQMGQTYCRLPCLASLSCVFLWAELPKLCVEVGLKSTRIGIVEIYSP